MYHLSESELFALVAYTHDLRIGDSEKNLYFIMNKALRHCKALLYC